MLMDAQHVDSAGTLQCGPGRGGAVFDVAMAALLCLC